jgi:hypothetical protein
MQLAEIIDRLIKIQNDLLEFDSHAGYRNDPGPSPHTQIARTICQVVRLKQDLEASLKDHASGVAGSAA